MININHGHNQELMSKCQKLKEYSLFVDTVRKYMQKDSKNPRKAFSEAINECIKTDILKDLLVSQKAEVLETMLTSFNKELYEKELKEEAIASGLAEGRELGLQLGLQQGIQQGRDDLLIDLVQKKLSKNCSVADIANALEQSIETIESIVAKLNNSQTE